MLPFVSFYNRVADPNLLLLHYYLLLKISGGHRDPPLQPQRQIIIYKDETQKMHQKFNFKTSDAFTNSIGFSKIMFFTAPDFFTS